MASRKTRCVVAWGREPSKDWWMIRRQAMRPLRREMRVGDGVEPTRHVVGSESCAAMWASESRSGRASTKPTGCRSRRDDEGSEIPRPPWAVGRKIR